MHIRRAVGHENLEAGLLSVNPVHQPLTDAIVKIALREANGAQRPLLSRQLFTLHQAIKRDKTACDLRIVNAVIKLRYDTEQMTQDATIVIHRLRGRDGLLNNAVTKG